MSAQLQDPSEVRTVLGWCLGNSEASDMIMQIAMLSQEADDIEDNENGNVSRVLSKALFDLEQLPYYLEHKATFQPLLLGSIIMWEASNKWAFHPRRETRMFAFVWRFILEQIVPVTAYMLGGHDHAVRVALEMHEYYHAGETFEDWEKENVNRRRETSTAVRQQ